MLNRLTASVLLALVLKSGKTASSSSVPAASSPDAEPFAGLVDSESVAVMNYDENGKYLGSEVLPPERTAEFMRHRDAALAHAEPFTEWWAKYRA